MVITDQFVYIHLPKTGGTFVAKALRRLFDGQRRLFIDTSTPEGCAELGVISKHQTVREIPAAHAGKPIAFTVRNPFDHYVSYFEFGWWKSHPGDTFDEEAIRSLYPHYPGITFAEYLVAHFDWRFLSRQYAPEPMAARLRSAGIGPLTYDYVRFLLPRPDTILQDVPERLLNGRFREELPDIRFLRQETLNRDLHAFLASMSFPPESTRFILEMEKAYPAGGRSRRSSDWRSYYTDDLRRLVRAHEWFLFSLFPEYGTDP
jgi:hypothetical protein